MVIGVARCSFWLYLYFIVHLYTVSRPTPAHVITWPTTLGYRWTVKVHSPGGATCSDNRWSSSQVCDHNLTHSSALQILMLMWDARRINPTPCSVYHSLLLSHTHQLLSPYLSETSPNSRPFSTDKVRSCMPLQSSSVISKKVCFTAPRYAIEVYRVSQNVNPYSFSTNCLKMCANIIFVKFDCDR